MSGTTPPFTIGMEEEYLLVDRDSRNVVIDPPKEIFERCGKLAEGGVVEHELLRSQIEVNTNVCNTVAEARLDLARLRRIVSEVAAEYNLAPIAASTHPFATWHAQQYTPKERYDMLSRDMQALARRLLIGGMHVHVGTGDDNDLRIALLNQFSNFLPLLLALSTSSPFWEGENTGLMSYRLTVFDNFPRTGLPERFTSFEDYMRQVRILEKTGVIKDATVIWWDLRPSARFPTLESRITDVCTRIDDATAIAALIQSIMRYLYRLHVKHLSWEIHPRFLIDQNRWRAMRYGCDGSFIDFANTRLIAVSQMLADIVELVREDAAELGCSQELEHVLHIPQRGTSAHAQLNLFQDTCDQGQESSIALQRVVDMLIRDSVAGVE